jgi:hypothetical protein
MYFSTSTLITLLTISLNTLSVYAVGANCKNSADKPRAMYFSACAAGMHVAACCPPSHPQLKQRTTPQATLYCYDATADNDHARIRPISPMSCEKGWMGLPMLGGVCYEGNKPPQAYLDQKCKLW